MNLVLLDVYTVNCDKCHSAFKLGNTDCQFTFIHLETRTDLHKSHFSYSAGTGVN
jgi:hypothetical protein